MAAGQARRLGSGSGLKELHIARARGSDRTHWTTVHTRGAHACVKTTIVGTITREPRAITFSGIQHRGPFTLEDEV